MLNAMKQIEKMGGEEQLINKGTKLMLYHRREPEPHAFKFGFNRMFSLLKREFHIRFEVSFSRKK